MDETYIKVKGEERFLYRAVDSTGQTIDFLLTARRDAAAAKRFFRRALANPGNRMPRVINVDKNRAYPVAVEELKEQGTIRPRCKLRQCGIEAIDMIRKGRAREGSKGRHDCPGQVHQQVVRHCRIKPLESHLSMLFRFSQRNPRA